MDVLLPLLLLTAMAMALPPERDLSKILPMNIYPKNNTWISTTPQNIPDESRIVGGSVATPHSFPYQVALLVPTAKGTTFCGGSILSEEWILTAAHCVDKRNGAVNVILGAHNIVKVEASQQQITVRDVHIHPYWDSDAIVNDIALLRLGSKARLNNFYASVIRLPSAAQSRQSFAGQTATVSGWGKTSDNSDISSVLRFLTATIMSNAECQRSFPVKSTHICVSGASIVGSCNGDSGGPLVVKDSDGTRTQIGIVSFGYKYCEVGYPSVYTRVTSYRQWIYSVSGISAASALSSSVVVAGLMTAVCTLTLQLLRQ